MHKPAPLLNIQALRAVAAYMVVAVHSVATLEGAAVNAQWLAFGHAGVDLFFVISGFIMVYTTAGRGITPSEFAMGRVARIVPFYWLVTLGVFSVALVAPSLLQATRADPVELLKSLAFVPFVKSNGLVHPVVFVGWTLNYEMFFYALFALGLFLRNGVWYVLGALVALTALHPFANGPIAAFYTNPILLEFGGGMLLGLTYRKRLNRFPHLCIAIGFALIALAPQLWPDAHRALAYGLPAVAIVSGAVSLELAGVVLIPALRHLGDASYALYLTHFFVTRAAAEALSFTEKSVYTAIVLAALSFIVATCVALFVHRWIERPLSQWARALLLSGSTGAANRLQVARRGIGTEQR